MNTTNDWNPDAYLQFAEERTQPSADLVARIQLATPQSIIDVGCGPGNSTAVLGARWRESRILGLDNSQTMIDKARSNYPVGQWAVGDARSLESRWDLIYSNAVIQWLPDHKGLLSHWWDCLAENGALAVQVPLYFDMPVKSAVEKTARNFLPAFSFPVLEDIMNIEVPDFYYETLAPRSKSFSMWKTSYIHVMDSHQAIIDMVKTTGMKPYLDALPADDMKLRFEAEALNEVRKAYPSTQDGKVLFPFERLFFIAYK